jgi:hypothetical protein
LPLRVAAVVALVGLTVLAAALLNRGERPALPPANRIVPDEFVARLFTDALGRPPDQRGWQAATSYFHENGCTTASLRRYARAVYLGDEYRGLRYDAPERALTLYAGLLAREPDQGGFESTVASLRSGDAWEGVVDTVLASQEFSEQVAPAACSPASPAYAAAVHPAPLDIERAGGGFTGDEAALQAALDATPAGGTVSLAPRAVVRISAPLRIPQGVTLATAGAPPLRRYASMARLVRAGMPPDRTHSSVVDLGSGARLSHVWVSGGRSWIGQPVKEAVTVQTQGDGATIEASRFTDTLGATNVFVPGPFHRVACTTATVIGNLVTGYTGEHTGGQGADGISVGCPKTTVRGNAVIDPTDVGIILYRADGTSQSSVVAHNRVIAASRSAFSALAADPLLYAGGREFSFEGASFHDNELWSSSRTHFDIGLAVGTHPWFAGQSDKGVGASFTDNTTGLLSIRTNNPFAVDGMLDARVEGNTLRALPMGPSPCKPGATVSRADGWASGSIQGPVSDQSLAGCITGMH